MTPNLFDFATSELSQDAFLCWLLSWAQPACRETHPSLHAVARALLDDCYRRAGATAPAHLSSLEIRRQEGGIDILCIVDTEWAILIEDKAGTRQRPGQLEKYRYHVTATLGFAAERVIPIYLQSGDQSDYREVEQQGFHAITRADLLGFLESAAGLQARETSDIFRDFSARLRRIEDGIQSYRHLPPDAWSRAWHPWKGFYSALQQQLREGHWDYVANPSGGFLGFWWYFSKIDGGEIYLQLEQDKFCFKVYVEESERRRELRQHWHERILETCREHSLKARRPDRFGHGQYMTVAILDQEYRCTDGNGKLDMPATLQLLERTMAVIDDCLQSETFA